MGSWSITIRGEGQHHNKLDANDANRMTADFVQRLRDAGHTVRSQAFTHGAEDDVDGQAYLDTLDETEKAAGE
jgi:hypothetical protein